jgi:hypothetical protein
MVPPILAITPAAVVSRNVIYLTQSMNPAVRTLSALLAAWLAVAGSFPACCWSMTAAHDHQPAPAQDTAHHHDHGGRSQAMAETASTIAAVPPADCDARPDLAIAANSTAHILTSFRIATRAEVTAGCFLQQNSWNTLEACAAAAPPGSPHASAFLDPLRI